MSGVLGFNIVADDLSALLDMASIPFRQDSENGPIVNSSATATACGFTGTDQRRPTDAFGI